MSDTDNKVFNEIVSELEYARAKWGTEFDERNTPNDWVSYINIYTGRAIHVTTGGLPFDAARFRASMLKVAGLAISAVENLDRLGSKFPKRHYDATTADAAGA